MRTIKEYAEFSGKSVQAVYKQLKSKDNSHRLEGHIFTKKINGKPSKFLDEIAEQILNEASKQTITVIEKDTRNAEIEKLKQDLADMTAEKEEWKDKSIRLADKMNEDMRNYNAKLTELTDKILLIEQSKEPVKKKRWFWQRQKDD